MSDKIRLAVIDYGAGNIANVFRAFESLGVSPILLDNPNDLSSFDKAVIPGVGAFNFGMEMLDKRGFTEAIQNFAISGHSLLGICLGMQLLASQGTENGARQGLGLVPGIVTKLDLAEDSEERVPHMGWAEVQSESTPSTEEAFYFAHSYHFVLEDPADLYSTFRWEDRTLVAAVKRDNVYGMQFHPEKSGAAGLRLLDQFIRN